MNFQFRPLDGDHCISTCKQVGKPEFTGSSIEIKPKKLIECKKGIRFMSTTNPSCE